MKDALGHGSAAHQSGVDQIGRPVVSPKALDVIRKNPSGFSVTIHGETPTSGHMVALPGRSRIINGTPSLHDVSEYARTHADVLGQPGAHIGGWHNEGKTYLDIAHNIRDRHEAIAAGQQRNQIAIWDVRHGREIPTGGNGR